MVAAALTIVSLMLRSLRWIFLLRRAHVRIPIRDAYIGYFAGLSLLLTPFLLGEIAVRALVHRARGRVPAATVVVVNLWERLLDLVALGVITGLLAIVLGRLHIWSAALLVIALLTAVPAVLARRPDRGRMARAAGRPPLRQEPDARHGTAVGRTNVARRDHRQSRGVGAAGARVLDRGAGWGQPISLVAAEYAYAASSSLGGLVLAPGGVLVAGASLLNELQAAGLGGAAAALSAFGIRLATVGVATALGGVFLLVHLRTPAAATAEHFDEIADAYDVQIPESRRDALLGDEDGA